MDDTLQRAIKLFVALDPTFEVEGGRSVRLSDMKRPEVASGMCGRVSDTFVAFLEELAITAETVEASEAEDVINGSFDYCLDDWYPLRAGSHSDIYFNHAAVKVILSQMNIFVDFTAAQFGIIGEWPIVREL